MPRRFRQWNKPVVLEEFRAAPKPVVHAYEDEQGRVWEVVLLRGAKGQIGSVIDNARPWDATHRGFRWTNLRRSYLFRPGDDRSFDRRTLQNQFDAAVPTKTMAEALHDRSTPAALSGRARFQDQIQEHYQRNRDAYDKRQGDAGVTPRS